MRNKRMEEKLAMKRAVDVSGCKRVDDDYVITNYIDGVDYCDAETEEWIWSIGRRRSDGLVIASLTTKFYQHPDFECIWLR